MVGLNDRDAPPFQAELFERRQNLEQLQLVVEIVLEPEHDLVEFERAPQLRVTPLEFVNDLDRVPVSSLREILRA